MDNKKGSLKLIENIRKMIQSMVSKNLKMTEITKLNVEVSNLMREREKLFGRIGEYVLEQESFLTDETLMKLKQEIEERNAGIEEKQKRVREIREINLCPVCEIEVAQDKEFCPKCGVELRRAVRPNDSNIKEGEGI